MAITLIEYGLMAGHAYFNTRAETNLVPVPAGWTEFFSQSNPSGFEAVSYQRGNEIVISYGGTDISVINTGLFVAAPISECFAKPLRQLT